MASGGAVGEQISGVLSGILGGTATAAIWVVIGFAFLLIVGGVIWYFGFYRKKFDITAKVISERAEHFNKIFFDKAAIFYDGKNATYYLKLLNTKVELALPKFNVFANTNKGDYVEILRKSEKDFRFLTPPKIDREYIVKSSGKLFPISEIKQREIENDISWIIQRQKINKSIIDPDTMFMKLMAYLPQLVSASLMIVLVIYVFKLMPEMLQAMNDFAKTIKGGTVETTVIGSLIPLLAWKKKA
jgi:hypothetical protein